MQEIRISVLSVWTDSSGSGEWAREGRNQFTKFT